MKGETVDTLLRLTQAADTTLDVRFTTARNAVIRTQR